MVLVGGSGTFTKGESIYVAWPQLNCGNNASPQAATQPHAPSRLEETIEFLDLRS